VTREQLAREPGLLIYFKAFPLADVSADESPTRAAAGDAIADDRAK
jgi:hypothetical protein